MNASKLFWSAAVAALFTTAVASFRAWAQPRPGRKGGSVALSAAEALDLLDGTVFDKAALDALAPALVTDTDGADWIFASVVLNRSPNDLHGDPLRI